MRPELLLIRALRRAVLLVRTRLTLLLLIVAALAAVPALAAAQTTTQVVEYYTTDAIGSVRAVTKQVSGQWQVVARHDFMPFGEEVAPPVPPQDKRLFTGKERDSETGQDYFEARYLRAGLGRFTTVDPLGSSGYAANPQSWNRYTFGLNNSLRIGDPFGLEPTEYYDTNGKWLGTDGKDNGVFSLITNPNTAKLAETQQQANGQVSAGDIPVADQKILTAADRLAVQSVYDNTGPNYEAAVAVGYTSPAPGWVESRGVIGPPAEPGQNATVTLPNMTGMTPRLVAHGHPGATDSNGREIYAQDPSAIDRGAVVLGAVTVTVGKQSAKVYFFDSKTTYAAVPLRKITNLSRR